MKVMNNLIIDLYEKECIKIGNFVLKNGDVSPIYIDLKNIISYPYIINKISKIIWEKIKDIEFNNICGVPYGGIPISTIISSNNNIPLLMLRKEKKKYGTAKQIEGMYKECNHQMIFMHHPLFGLDPEEADSHMVLPKIQRSIILDLLDEYKVKAVFTGHWHENNITKYKNTELITTGPISLSLGDEPSGIRLIEIDGEKLTHEYINL